MAIAKPDFTRIFGSSKNDLTPISSSNYVQGWDFVGSTPPTKNDFTYLQNLSDLRTIWLAENNFGRLINIRAITASTTYTPSAGTRYIIVEAVGGGGAGGGTTATSSTTVSSGFGGNSGAYGMTGIIDASSLSSVIVTVGTAGTGNAGAAGAAGGASSFGPYLSVPGGGGGAAGPAGSGTSASSDNTYGGSPTGSALLYGSPSSVGLGAFSLNTAVAQNTVKSGKGGDSRFGVGGGGIIGGAAARPGAGYGAGGGGMAVGPAAASPIAGGNGSGGIVIIREFS